jgi:hypothetical protein
MKFGDAIKLVFEAHYEDLASGAKEFPQNTRYTNEKLLTALKCVPAKWRQFILQEFAVMEGVIRREILTCPHNATSKPYNGREECVSCGSHRSLELEDNDPNSYNERKVWSEWRIF